MPVSCKINCDLYEGVYAMRIKDEENERRQREMLLNAAWKLFRQKGYQETTMRDILEEAKCSKGRFYYYFNAKAELLDSLSEVFDQKYLEFYSQISKGQPVLDQLLELTHYMLDFMSKEIGVELLTNLYINQLAGVTEIRFWGENRLVRNILTEILSGGQENGQIRMDLEIAEMVSDIIEEERNQIISWCLEKGRYPLTEVSIRKLERIYRIFSKELEKKK